MESKASYPVLSGMRADHLQMGKRRPHTQRLCRRTVRSARTAGWNSKSSHGLGSLGAPPRLSHNLYSVNQLRDLLQDVS